MDGDTERIHEAEIDIAVLKNQFGMILGELVEIKTIAKESGSILVVYDKRLSLVEERMETHLKEQHTRQENWKRLIFPVLQQFLSGAIMATGIIVAGHWFGVFH